MTDVWVGWTHVTEEQGYGYDQVSEPLVIFDNANAAHKWKNNGKDKKVKKIYVAQKAKCNCCDGDL